MTEVTVSLTDREVALLDEIIAKQSAMTRAKVAHSMIRSELMRWQQTPEYVIPSSHPPGTVSRSAFALRCRQLADGAGP